MRNAVITADQGRQTGFYQYFVDGIATGIAADPINAGTNSNDVASICAEFIESLYGGKLGRVTHDKDCIHVEVV